MFLYTCVCDLLVLLCSCIRLYVTRYAPNFEKVEVAYCFGLVRVCVCVSVCVSVLVFEKKSVRVFEFHKQIPYKNS